MKRIIFFLLFFPFLLFANSYFYDNRLITLKTLINSYNLQGVIFCDPLSHFHIYGLSYRSNYCHYQISNIHFNMQLGQLLINGKLYSTDIKNYSNVNMDCIKNNSTANIYGFYQITSSLVDFCVDKQGYTYSKDLNAWIPNDNGTPICPSGKVWSDSQEKCIDDLELQKKKCYDYCGGEDLTKSFTVNSDGSTKCVCKLCSDIKQSYIDYCSAQGGILKNFVCKDNGKRIISLQPSSQTPNICLISPHTKNSDNSTNSSVNHSNNTHNSNNMNSTNTTHVNNTNMNTNITSNTSNSNINNNISINKSSINSSGSVSSNSNTHISNNDKNSSINCCNYYYSGNGQWVLVNGCLEYTIPSTGQKCRIRLDGLKCYSCFSNGSSNTNSNTNAVLAELNGANSKLDKLNNTLNTIINLKPTKSYDSNLSSSELNLFSGFTSTISNVKKSLSDLTSSVGKIKSLLSNPKKVTLFSNNNIVTCPIVTHLYGQNISFDICKFVSPYKPVLELFFTLVFSLTVIFYFFDVILRGGNK